MFSGMPSDKWVDRARQSDELNQKMRVSAQKYVTMLGLDKVSPVDGAGSTVDVLVDGAEDDVSSLWDTLNAAVNDREDIDDIKKPYVTFRMLCGGLRAARESTGRDGGDDINDGNDRVSPPVMMPNADRLSWLPLGAQRETRVRGVPTDLVDAVSSVLKDVVAGSESQVDKMSITNGAAVTVALAIFMRLVRPEQNIEFSNAVEEIINAVMKHIHTVSPQLVSDLDTRLSAESDEVMSSLDILRRLATFVVLDKYGQSPFGDSDGERLSQAELWKRLIVSDEIIEATDNQTRQHQSHAKSVEERLHRLPGSRRDIVNG